MSKDSDSESPDFGLVCSWCGKSFSPESEAQRRGLVCPKCARLLEGAGLSYEEVYNQPDQKGRKKCGGCG